MDKQSIAAKITELKESYPESKEPISITVKMLLDEFETVLQELANKRNRKRSLSPAKQDAASAASLEV